MSEECNALLLDVPSATQLDASRQLAKAYILTAQQQPIVSTLALEERRTDMQTDNIETMLHNSQYDACNLCKTCQDNLFESKRWQSAAIQLESMSMHTNVHTLYGKQ